VRDAAITKHFTYFRRTWILGEKLQRVFMDVSTEPTTPSRVFSLL
jgi:hypothetical protein